MKWFDLAVCPQFSWPNSQVEVPFEGYKVVLQPLRKEPETAIEMAATLSVSDPNGTSFEAGGTVASRFLSRLAWSNDGGVVELFSGGSNSSGRPGRLGQGAYSRSAWAQVEPWDFIYLPAAHSQEADLALGLFREGMSVNSTPFAFLSYRDNLSSGIERGNTTSMSRLRERVMQISDCSCFCSPKRK